MTRDYELGFILNPEVGEEQTRTILERVEQIVANHGGQVVRVNQWGRRRLAYPIEHHRDGLYVFVDMILTPETIAELDRTLRVSEEVLRHMVRRRDPKTVQKEREARAATAAAPASAVPEAEEKPPVPVGEETQEETEEEVPVVLSAEEIEHVPPAIDIDEEETEADEAEV